MAGVGRGWVIMAVVLGTVGLLFILWGFGVDLGRWWPSVFCAIGIASLIRGLRHRENVFLGFLLLGWGAAGIAALNHDSIGIVRAWPFLIGALIEWIPVSSLLAKLGGGDR